MLKPKKIYQSKVVIVLLRSWVLSIFLGSLVFFLLHINPDPYLFTLVDSSSSIPDPEGSRTYYLDLNSDGQAESFNFSNITDSASSLLVFTSQGVAFEQWNFKGKFTEGLLRLISSDCDHDGKLEISTVTLEKNHLYLNVVEPYSINPLLVDNKFIDTIWTKYESPYTYLKSCPETDLNLDGCDEIIFSFSAGYARQPRKVYACNLVDGTIWGSPYAGSVLTSLTSADLNRDGKPELIGQCYAPNNYMDESIDLKDNSSWFIVLDNHLNYKVPPIKTGPHFSETNTIGLPENDTLKYYVYSTGYRDSIFKNDWYSLDSTYNIHATDFPYKVSLSHPFIFAYPAYGRGGIFFNRWDPALFIDARGNNYVNNKFPRRAQLFEMQNPTFGIREFAYCFLTDGQSLNVSFYSIDGKNLGSIPIENFTQLKSVCWAGRINKNNQLFLSGDKQKQWFEVRRNPLRFFQYLIWIGLISGFWGFIKLIRFSAAFENSTRESLRREILELQLKTVKNQLDPHFTFNALNGLSHLVMTGDTIRVGEFISHFSRLLRTYLNTYDQALVKIKHEIQFLENYMELQRIRFDDRIRLEFSIHEDVDTNLLVPKMILQTHVENAVKHGLQPKLLRSDSEIGLVKVLFFKEIESTVILIEDNGVGRGNGHGPREESTGKGLQVLEQIFTSVKLLYRIRITQEFEDIKNADGKPAGTRVRIVIG
jgi:hypothetical protein